MRYEKSVRSLPIKWLLNYNYAAQKNIDKIMSDLFVFRCSIGKFIFYAGGEHKKLHRQLTYIYSTILLKLFYFTDVKSGEHVILQQLQ